MSLFRVADEAKADLHDIWMYVADDSVPAADRLIDGVLNKFPTLADFPGMGRSRPDLQSDLRSFTVGNYVIYYRPIPGGVEIARVLHGARDGHRLLGRNPGHDP